MGTEANTSVSDAIVGPSSFVLSADFVCGFGLFGPPQPNDNNNNAEITHNNVFLKLNLINKAYLLRYQATLPLKILSAYCL